MKIREVRNNRGRKFSKRYYIEIMIILIIFLVTIGSIFFAVKRQRKLNPIQENAKISENKNKVVAPKKEEEPYEPVEGGELFLSAIKFDSLDPYKNKDKSVNDLLRLVYDSLFEFDGEYNLKHELASAYSIEDSGKTIIVSLNNNARWQDGSKVLPEDVEFTFNYIRNNSKSPYYSLISNIESAKANGDKIIFTLKKSNSLEIYNLTFPIINKKSIVGGSFNVIANGMFKIGEYKTGKYLRLIKNDIYYGNKPYISSVLVNTYDNNKIRKNMFLSRKTNIIESNYYELKDYEFEIYKKASYKTNRYDFIAYNYKKDFFSQAVNRKKIYKILSIDNYKNDVYKEELEYKHYPTFRFDYIEKNENINLDNIKNENLIIITDKDDPMKHRLAYVIQSQLSFYNIKSEVKGLSRIELLETVKSGGYDIAVLTYNAKYNDDILTLLNNEVIFPIAMEEITNLMENIYTSTESTIESRYNTFLEKLSNYKYFVGVGFKKDYVIYDKNIGGFLDSTDLELYNGIEHIYIKQFK